MKKIIMLLLVFLFSITTIKATTVKKVLIDAEAEIAGGLRVREIIHVKDQDTDINIHAFYKDKSLKKFDGTTSSLNKSSIHNASGIVIRYIGLIDAPENAKYYSYDFFYEKHFTPIEYEYEDDGEYYNFTLPKKEGENIYYVEYVVLDVCVEHNDAAELYYKYLSRSEYDIEDVTVYTKLPFYSELFKIWAHGDKNVKTIIEKDVSIMQNNIKNYKKGSSIENRILYDLELFSFRINESKKSNMDAIKIIEEIEEKRLSNTKLMDVMKIILLCSLSLLVVLVLIYLIFIKKIFPKNILKKKLFRKEKI